MDVDAIFAPIWESMDGIMRASFAMSGEPFFYDQEMALKLREAWGRGFKKLEADGIAVVKAPN